MLWEMGLARVAMGVRFDVLPAPLNQVKAEARVGPNKLLKAAYGARLFLSNPSIPRLCNARGFALDVRLEPFLA